MLIAGLLYVIMQVLFQYCAEEVAAARHTALFQRFIKVQQLIILVTCCFFLRMQQAYCASVQGASSAPASQSCGLDLVWALHVA